MNRRRVVITGMGVVSPVGNNVETAWNNVKNGVSGLGNISLFDSSRLKVHVDAEVKNFNIEDYGISSRATRKMARFSKFCLAASAQAIEDAGYTKETLQAEKTGVLSTKTPGFVSVYFVYICILRPEPTGCNPHRRRGCFSSIG